MRKIKKVESFSGKVCDFKKYLELRKDEEKLETILSERREDVIIKVQQALLGKKLTEVFVFLTDFLVAYIAEVLSHNGDEGFTHDEMMEMIPDLYDDLLDDVIGNIAKEEGVSVRGQGQ